MTIGMNVKIVFTFGCGHPTHRATVLATKGVRKRSDFVANRMGQSTSDIFCLPFKDRSRETGKELRCPSQPAYFPPTMSGER